MRKSVSYLIKLRDEVKDTGKEMFEVSIDFADVCSDLDQLSTDKIRTAESDRYKAVQRVERQLQKAIKNHKLAVKTLKEFF